MNPVNFVDPMGLWKRKSDWSYGKAIVSKQRGDTLAGLAKLVTGNENDWPLLLAHENEKTVEVTPLILAFKKNVQKNISLVGKEATKSWNVNFSFATSKYVALNELYESDINQLFQPFGNSLFSDCSKAAAIVVAKGLINTLKPGEFDALGFTAGAAIPRDIIGWKENPEDIKKSKSIEDVEVGDITHFYNKKDYFDRFGYAGMEGEHVVKVGEDQYYGIPTGVMNYQEWKQSLCDAYNELAGGKHPASLSDVIGYYGFIVRLDYFKISQMLFDLRNRRK